jgi:hypothetical protein
MSKTPQSQEAEYWKQRCLAAEDVLNTPTPRNKETYDLWAARLYKWIELERATHITDINAGDIPTPSKGQETKDNLQGLKKKIETEINDLHEEFKNLPQEDQDKRKSWMAVRCDVLRQVLFWIASLPNSEQGAQECDASKAKS